LRSPQLFSTLLHYRNTDKSEENTKEETLEILQKTKLFYEQFHQIEVDNEVLTYLVDNVDRYIKNRTFPDKAIDIFDLACVKAR
ncbi:hypothetical protein LIQ24_22630, partial [Blautia faecis]|nr:hypothetical protein [Blautia faecis]